VVVMNLEQRRALVLLSLVGGSLCTVATFKEIFWQFDPLYFLTPVPVMGPAIGIVVGWTVGLVVVRAVARLADHRAA